jgi:hypothetical protein
MSELPTAAEERERLATQPPSEPTPLSIHLSQGLAYTVGSALGSMAPSTDACLAAFVAPNKVGLTAGGRAWSKHAHRSAGEDSASDAGWWGRARGPVATINENALKLFWRVMDRASWRNLHWLPHQVLVYEVRVPEGYGMRWSQDRSGVLNDEELDRLWTFRGYVEPMMENGHELQWRH